MTAYIRRGGAKKRQQCEYAEAALRRAVVEAYPDSRIAKAAERLRTAKLGCLKSVLHELEVPDRRSSSSYRTALAERRRWESMTVDEVIATLDAGCSGQ